MIQVVVNGLIVGGIYVVVAIGFAVVYGALIVVDVYLLVKFARQPDAAH